MRHQELEEMRRLPLFQSADPARIEAMLHGAFLQRFPAHVELVSDGDPADFLHIVIEGAVEIFSAHRQRETTLGVAGPGHSFILAAVLLDRPYLQSARVMAASRILLVPADAVRRTFAEDAGFARALALDVALAYRGAIKELKNQKLRSGLERLAAWLLTHDAETGARGRFDFPFDKKVLAARLGMAPEGLSRAFNALGAYQVQVQGPTVIIRDPEALRKLAHPSSTIDGSST